MPGTIHQVNFPVAGHPFARHVKKRPRLRKREAAAGVGVGADVFLHGNRWTGHGEAAEIEGRGEERVLAHVKKPAGLVGERHIASEISTALHGSALAGLTDVYVNSGVFKRGYGTRGEQHGAA